VADEKRLEDGMKMSFFTLHMAVDSSCCIKTEGTNLQLLRPDSQQIGATLKSIIRSTVDGGLCSRG
jgi:hypothetical protein